MNNIYIINNYVEREISLDFNKNNFEKENIYYDFEIVDIYTLHIHWGEDDIEIFKTDDSYIYFSEKYNKSTKESITKFRLINDEWDDQAIIDYRKNELRRIKDKEEYGSFHFLDDYRMIINWNYWGEEEYIMLDKYTYIKNSVKYNRKETENPSNIPLHIFIHICMLNDWQSIFIEQLNIIKKSGLYENATYIHLGIVGSIAEYEKNKELFDDNKINVIYIDSNVEIYEIHTINSIKKFCSTISNEAYILYLHTKGVRNAGNKIVTESWRNMMQYFLVEKYNECINNLHEYDTLGNNIVNMHCFNKDNISINKEHTLHYSGNFWWSKKTYIDKLPYLASYDFTDNSINTRYRAENWICSNYPNAKIGIIFQDDTNTHPYHRFVFPKYKEQFFYVKSYSVDK